MSAPFIPALYHLTHHVLIDKGGKKTFQCLINLKSIRGRKAFILLPWFRSCYSQQHNKCTLCTNTNGLSTFLHFSRVGTDSIFLQFWKILTKERAAQLIFKQGEGKIVLQSLFLSRILILLKDLKTILWYQPSLARNALPLLSWVNLWESLCAGLTSPFCVLRPFADCYSTCTCRAFSNGDFTFVLSFCISLK